MIIFAFGVPTAVTDLNVLAGAWNPQDYILTQGFQRERDGPIYRQLEAADIGALTGEWALPDGTFTLYRNTAAELLAATTEMFNTTTDCVAWRPPPAYMPRLPRPNGILMPLKTNRPRDLLIPPSRR